jgi:hypothetical protein
MSLVNGDPQGLRSLGQTYGATARAVDTQTSHLSGALSQVGTTSFAGPAGDSVRAFLAEMQTANEAAARAFDRIAAQIPRVAQAIEEAKQDETLMDQARQRVLVAQQRVGDAETALADASEPVVCSVAGVHPTAGQQQALAAAEHELQLAETDLQQSQHQLQLAQHRFQQADEHRQSVLRAFAALCQDEAAAAGCPLPMVPHPAGLAGSLDNALALVNTLLELSALPGAISAGSNAVKVMAAVRNDDMAELAKLDPEEFAKLENVASADKALSMLKDFEEDTKSGALDEAVKSLSTPSWVPNWAKDLPDAAGILGDEASLTGSGESALDKILAGANGAGLALFTNTGRAAVASLAGAAGGGVDSTLIALNSLDEVPYLGEAIIVSTSLMMAGKFVADNWDEIKQRLDAAGNDLIQPDKDAIDTAGKVVDDIGGGDVGQAATDGFNGGVEAARAAYDLPETEAKDLLGNTAGSVVHYVTHPWDAVGALASDI